MADDIREATSLRVISHCGGGFKNQMKKADKSLASIALLIGKIEANARSGDGEKLRNGKGRPVWGGRTGDFGQSGTDTLSCRNARHIRKRLTSFIYLKTE